MMWRCDASTTMSADPASEGSAGAGIGVARTAGLAACRFAIAAAYCVAASGLAHAGSSSVGFAITSEREPDDFGKTRGTDFEINGSHTFDNHVSIGASVKHYNTTSTDSSSTNIEGTVGYTLKTSDKTSLTASAGVGGKFQNKGEGKDFPYYVFKAAADVEVAKKITWNALSLRYRNAFDTSNDYDTPEVATGVTFRVDESSSMSFKVSRDWKEGSPSYTGLEIGYKYHF